MVLRRRECASSSCVVKPSPESVDKVGVLRGTKA